MCISKGAQVEVVFGINTRWHIDVELQHFQKLSFQFIPAKIRNANNFNEKKYTVNYGCLCGEDI